MQALGPVVQPVWNAVMRKRIDQRYEAINQETGPLTSHREGGDGRVHT